MPIPEPVPTHLHTVDATKWPRLVQPLDGFALKTRARLAEAEFARACDAAGVTLSGDDADILVNHERLFERIAAAGWTGLAEGYMAGEWSVTSSDVLVEVIAKLLGQGYVPRRTSWKPRPETVGAMLPSSLVQHFSGDRVSAFQGHFATGVATTERKLTKSYPEQRAKQRGAKRRYIDVTTYEAPLDADRADLGDIQARSAQQLLDLVGAGRGTRMLEYPNSGGAVALAAIGRGVVVDTLAISHDSAAHLREYLILNGAANDVRVAVGKLGDAQWAQQHGPYDAIVSFSQLESCPKRDKVQYLRAMDRMLLPGGRIGVQSVMARRVQSESVNRACRSALQVLGAYVWPGMEYQYEVDFLKLVEQQTHLQAISISRAPEHLRLSIRLQRQMFEGRLREAAADGYDEVFRRLWLWQFAVREAVASVGGLDLAQAVLVRKHRGGRR